jgi:uncharacterized lipoprotein YmbA
MRCSSGNRGEPVATHRLLALLIILGSLGCSVLPKSSAKSDFFLLTALEPAPTAATAAAPSILLGPVVLPEYLDRPELVTRLASNQLRVEELEQWAEPLRDSFPRILTQNLATLLGSGRVQRLSRTEPSRPDLVVSVEVRRFEKTSGGTVELTAHWTIRDGEGDTERLRRETRLSYAAAGKNTQAAVASMSYALATLSREIAGGVQRVARGQASADDASKALGSAGSLGTRQSARGP